MSEQIVNPPAPSVHDFKALADQIAAKTFVTSTYQSGTSFTLASPITVQSGVNLLVLFKHFTSATTFTFDLLVITCSGTSLYATFIQKNSQVTISSMTYSGKNITINFGQTVYMSAHSIVIQS